MCARREALVARVQARGTTAKAPGSAAPLVHDANVADLENRLRERFGTKVRLKYFQGKGSVDIAFFSDDDLERILQIVGVKVGLNRSGTSRLLHFNKLMPDEHT